jgi:hypothetical protein
MRFKTRWVIEVPFQRGKNLSLQFTPKIAHLSTSPADTENIYSGDNMARD